MESGKLLMAYGCVEDDPVAFHRVHQSDVCQWPNHLQSEDLPVAKFGGTGIMVGTNRMS